MNRRAASVVGTVACAAVVLACESVLGLPDHVSAAAQADEAGADADSDAAQACPPSAETNACFKCTDEQCCNEYATCAADPRCALYYKTCLPSCRASGKDYFTCVVQCDGMEGAGHALFAPYYACSEANCLGPCQEGSDAGGAEDPCTGCSYASCREVTVACTADRECDTLQACVGTCSGRSDYDACTAACKQGKSQHAQDLFNQKFTCILQFCQSACAP